MVEVYGPNMTRSSRTIQKALKGISSAPSRIARAVTPRCTGFSSTVCPASAGEIGLPSICAFILMHIVPQSPEEPWYNVHQEGCVSKPFDVATFFYNALAYYEAPGEERRMLWTTAYLLNDSAIPMQRHRPDSMRFPRRKIWNS